MADVLDLLQRSSFFGAAKDTELAPISGRLRPQSFADGETVVREGDPGDTCYLVREGAAAVVTRDLIGEETTLKVFGPGDTFGELALVGDGRPRTATVRARGTLETLVMHRTDFDLLEASCPAFAAAARAYLERLDRDAWLKRGSPFARLPPAVIERLSARVRVEWVQANAVVMREGGPPDAFRVVRTGSLAVSLGDERLQVFGAGDCFGEVGLLTDAPLNATVTAIENSELVVVDRADFHALVRDEPSFERLMWELARIRGGEVAPDAGRVPDREVEAVLPRLIVGRRSRWPWVFGVGAAAFGALTLISARGGESAFLDAAIVVGALVGPVTFVTYLAESDLLADRPLPIVATFLATGIVAVPLAALTENAIGVGPGTLMGAIAIAGIEELAKLLGVAPLAGRRLLRFQRDGVIYGAAAGMGFAAFETFLYGRAILGAGEGVLGVLWLRALLSPFGHGTWTAIAAAGIFRSKGTGRIRPDAIVLSAIASSVALHALWNWMPLPGLLGLAWFAAVGALGIWLLSETVRRSVSESARSALALNPELAKAAGTGKSLRCRVCEQVSLPGSHYCVRCGSALRA